MKFKSGSRRPAAEYEKDWVQRWKEDKTFEKSVELRDPANSYVFYDGPPFITGVPHFGTLLSSIVKDAVPRYWTMKGFRVERRWGWDCHGLPAENFVEKQLGIVDHRQILTDELHRFEPKETVSKSDINAGFKVERLSKKDWDESAAKPVSDYEKTGKMLSVVSLEKYIDMARQSMTDNSETWRPVIDRVGRWVDMSRPYRTMNPDYMESVWWAFKKLYDAGKIYEGAKVLMYDTHFATPVAKAEVTMDNDAYQTVTDPSVYVGFRLDGDLILNSDNGEKIPAPVYMLAWTTTPWTLFGNTALAINTEMNYAILYDAEKHRKFVVAKNLAEKTAQLLGVDLHILGEISGDKLVGLSYQPLFDDHIFADSVVNYYPFAPTNLHKIWGADYVSDDSGTGVVHIAPIYGEEDYALARENHVPARETMDENGFYWSDISRQLDKIFAQSFGGDYREILKKAEVSIDKNGNYEAFSSNKMIAKALEKLGVIWKIEMIRHDYPFNPRSHQRIMYRAIPSWFFDIQNSKSLLLSQNENINWFPTHLKHGRFAKNIEQAPDWNLSRNRYWASAMPVWKGDKGSVHVVGSYQELFDLSGVKLDDYHRPWVDDIHFETDNIPVDVRAKYHFNGKPGETFSRISEVLDCWFESGSMPFAQLHYPFENREKFEKNYPADFIVEYIGQVRAWFYYVHVVNTALADIGAFNGDQNRSGLAKENAFKNVITTGVIAGDDGRKMSKSLGNYTDPNELMDKFSADSLRFLLLSSPLLNGEDFALHDKDVGDVARKLNMIWNMYDFFTMYAEADGWAYDGQLHDPLSTLKNPLDIWVVSRLHQLVAAVEENMNRYDIPDALEPVLPFLDDASNWYVRRSRRRFHQSDDMRDKNDAYRTLHYVLVRLCYVLAPFTPFLAEELYRQLTGDHESIHLKNWLPAGAVNEKVVADMARTRVLITNGLALRMRRDENEDAIKIRQPLASASYAGKRLDSVYEQIMSEELNVKQLTWVENLDEHLVKYDKVEGGIDPEIWVEISKKMTPELHREGLAREVIRAVQSARKQTNLKIDDRIALWLETTDAELQKAIDEYSAMIRSEVLADENAKPSADVTETKIGDVDLKIALQKIA